MTAAEDWSGLAALRAGGASCRLARIEGRAYVVAVSEIGGPEAFDPRACLAHNTTLGIGALGLLDGRLVLRHAAPVEGMSAEAIRLFLHEAERLRRLVVRSPAGAEVALWAGYSD